MSSYDNEDQTFGNEEILTQTTTKVKKPPMYKVIMLNDDFTPMDFVIEVLQRFFQISHEKAADIMMTVHKKGAAVCGTYTFEVAETKAMQVVDFAQKHDHPLQATVEPA